MYRVVPTKLNNGGNMKQQNLTSANFILIAIGQTISLMGNGILRFALPLYLLKETGSSAVFGIVSAVSFLPLIVLMPIGGVIADRVNKRNVMVILDLLVGIVMIFLYLLLGRVDLLSLLTVVLMILYSISGLYQPTVQASIPIILNEDSLIKGNGVISSISALSGLLSPVLGGFLFGIYGIYPIIIVSILCFFMSSFLELFLKIPHQKQYNGDNLLQTIKSDFKISITFIVKEKPIIFKMILMASVLNAFISSMLLIAMPILITERLNLTDQLYGISQGVLAFGGLVGGILTGVLGGKLKISKIYKLFLILTITLVPICIAPLFLDTKVLSYTLIICSAFMVMAIATTISIQFLTYVQQQTPPAIIGKVMALLLTMAICAQPIGQVLYGVAFEYLVGSESLIIMFAIVISLVVSFYTKNQFSSL